MDENSGTLHNMRLFPLLFVLFLFIPVIEIYLLIEIGSRIGAFYTIVLVVGTAVLGATLIRSQGLSTLKKIRDFAQRGELPAIPIIEGMMLLIAGALLLTPGFFTDTLGFLVVIPPLRQQLAHNIVRTGLFRAAQMNRQYQNKSSTHSPPQSRRPQTLEGEFHRDDD